MFAWLAYVQQKRGQGGENSIQRQQCSHVHHARLPALVLGDLIRHQALPAVLMSSAQACDACVGPRPPARPPDCPRARPLARPPACPACRHACMPACQAPRAAWLPGRLAARLPPEGLHKAARARSMFERRGAGAGARAQVRGRPHAAGSSHGGAGRHRVARGDLLLQVDDGLGRVQALAGAVRLRPIPPASSRHRIHRVSSTQHRWGHVTNHKHNRDPAEGRATHPSTPARRDARSPTRTRRGTRTRAGTGGRVR